MKYLIRHKKYEILSRKIVNMLQKMWKYSAEKYINMLQKYKKYFAEEYEIQCRKVLYIVQKKY